MSIEEAQVVLQQHDAKILKLERRIQNLRLSKETILAELIASNDDDEEPDNTIATIPIEKATRFEGWKQQPIVDAILSEATKPLKIKQIAKLAVEGGYASHTKTANKIRASIATVLANGAKEGKYIALGGGSYQYNFERSDHAAAQ